MNRAGVFILTNRRLNLPHNLHHFHICGKIFCVRMFESILVRIRARMSFPDGPMPFGSS